MKFFTKNLMLFAVTLFIWTILFRWALSEMITLKMGWWILIVSLLYGIGCFISGWIIGKRDRKDLPLFDIGFRFNFMTFFICSLVAELWFFFGFNSPYESIQVVHTTTLWWGIGIVVHFIFFLISRKKSIQGIHKDELFE